MNALNVDDLNYEPLIVTIKGQDYPVVDLTAEIERKLEPLEKSISLQRHDAFIAQRKSLVILLNVPADEIKELTTQQVRAIRQFIIDGISLGKKKEESKSG